MGLTACPTGLYIGVVADSEGEPAVRTYYGRGYYPANIGDVDGNHLEIVHKSFNPSRR